MNDWWTPTIYTLNTPPLLSCLNYSLVFSESQWAWYCTYRTEFWCVDMYWKLSGKQSESTPNSRIWLPLAIPDMMREVSKSCRILASQRRDHLSHVVPPLLTGRISTCGCLVQIEWRTIGINVETAGFGSLWPLLTWWRKFRSVAETFAPR